MGWKAIIAILVVAAGSAGAARRLSPTQAAKSDTVTVLVGRAQTHAAVADAAVVVVAENGAELVSVRTDRFGVSRFPLPTLYGHAAGEHPKYVLVETPVDFVSGLRWDDGAREYNILVTPIELR